MAGHSVDPPRGAALHEPAASPRQRVRGGSLPLGPSSASSFLTPSCRSLTVCPRSRRARQIARIGLRVGGLAGGNARPVPERRRTDASANDQVGQGEPMTDRPRGVVYPDLTGSGHKSQRRPLCLGDRRSVHVVSEPVRSDAVQDRPAAASSWGAPREPTPEPRRDEPPSARSRARVVRSWPPSSSCARVGAPFSPRNVDGTQLGWSRLRCEARRVGRCCNGRLNAGTAPTKRPFPAKQSLTDVMACRPPHPLSCTCPNR